MPLIETALIIKVIFAGLAAFGSAVILIKILTWTRVIDWFKKRTALKVADANNIAIAIKRAREDGKVTYVQGIFNTNNDELLDAQCFEAEQLDAKLSKKHAQNDVVIFQ